MKIKFEERRDAEHFAYMVANTIEEHEIVLLLTDVIEEEKFKFRGGKKLKHISLEKFKLNMSKEDVQLIVVGRNKAYEFWFDIIEYN